MARRKLTTNEANDWAAYASLVKPLHGRAALSPPEIAPPPAAPEPSPRPADPPVPARPQRAPWLEIGNQPAGVDTATWRRVRGGRVPVSRSLDLHGHTAQRAFHALEHFLRNAQAERLRMVEIITGRGSGETGGVLRRELPLWLNLPHIRPMILAAVHPHVGNVGATRILLRRP